MMIELDSSKQDGDIELIYDDKIEGQELIKRNRWTYKRIIFRLISKLVNKQ